MSDPVSCIYENRRYDFRCDERSTDSDFCIFHDINYLSADNYEKNKEKVSKRFEKKLVEYSSNQVPLKFIGYFLPNISLWNKQLTSRIYFTDATFYGQADFSSATFHGQADFSSATFHGQADFRATTFDDEASFKSVKFSQEANFDQVTFSEEADFESAIFSQMAGFGSSASS